MTEATNIVAPRRSLSTPLSFLELTLSNDNRYAGNEMEFLEHVREKYSTLEAVETEMLKVDSEDREKGMEVEL